MNRAVVLLALIVGGCAASPRQDDSPDGGVADQGGIRHDLRGADLAAGHDLAARPSDLAGDDLAGDDLAVPPDLSVDDQAVAADLAAASDLAAPSDLATRPDLAVPRDLAMPPDLTPPPVDMAFVCCPHACLFPNTCAFGCCPEDLILNRCTPNPFFCPPPINSDM